MLNIVKKHWLKFTSVGLGMILILILNKIIPYNLDEFLHYHTIFCNEHLFPNNHLNTFKMGCKNFNLKLWGIFDLPLRSYYYTGNLHSLFYWPFYLIYKNPLSARLLGFIFIIIQSFFLYKITKIKFEYILLFLIAFFPYFYPHIIDTGPISFAITSIFIIIYLFKEYAKKPNFWYLFGITILLFLGIWNKLNHIWYFPFLFIIFIYIGLNNLKTIKKNIKSVWKHCLINTIVLTGLISSLLLAKDSMGNYPYYKLSRIIENKSIYETITEFLIPQPGVLSTLFNPFSAAARAYNVAFDHTFFALFYNLIIFGGVFILMFILYKFSKKQIKMTESFLLYALFCLMLLMISRTYFIFPWLMHQVVLTFPFLILSILLIIKQFKVKWQWVILIIFIFFNLYPYINFTNFPVKAHEDSSKVQAHKILSDEYLAKNYIYIVLDWGVYTQQALYGNKNQTVLHFPGLNSMGDEYFLTDEYIGNIKKILKKENKLPIFIHRKTNTDDKTLKLLSQNFKLQNCTALKKGTVWKMLIQNDGSKGNICLK